MTTCIHEFCNDTATHQYAGHPICYDCWYRQMAYYVTERPWEALTENEAKDCAEKIDDMEEEFLLENE